MQNIDIITNPDNREFRDFDRKILGSDIFVDFINSIATNKLNDKSFIDLLISLDSSVWTSSNFVNAIRSLHSKDDDIITNGKFSGSIKLMRSAFLRSKDFNTFTAKLDPNLLERRDPLFSFSGTLNADYFSTLFKNLPAALLKDPTFNRFINLIDVGILNDKSFENFITNIDSSLLADDGFADYLIDSSNLLTDGDFTSALLSLDKRVLENETFRAEIKTLDDSYLKSSQFTADISQTSPVFSDSGELVSLSVFPALPLLPGTEDRVRQQLAEFAVNQVIMRNGLNLVNPDILGIVETYFDGPRENPEEIFTISPKGFEDSLVTQTALKEIKLQIEENILDFPDVQLLLQSGVDTGGFTTDLDAISSALNFSDDLLRVQGVVGARPEDETPAQARWKYSKLDNVPGILAGGVGYGGQPPKSAELILDFREVSGTSKVDILLSGGTLGVTIDYEVTIGDVFDFLPGGGGFDDFRDDPSFGAGILAVGVSQLQEFERLELTADVPFMTQFTKSDSFTIQL